MAHLIDKDTLVAEIDRQKIGYNVDGKHSIEYDTTRKILNIIDTLEVKEVEVDLDKELEDWLGERIGKWTGKECERMCRHFFELGLKAQKGE